MGLPETVASDNGPQFQAEEFKNFLNWSGVKQVFSPSYYARANCQAEDVKPLKQALTKSLLNPKTSNPNVHNRTDSFSLCISK
jgi:hypothetical protein